MWKAGQLFDLRGRRAIVTGGTRGLGSAIAKCLLENGCHVAALSRHPAAIPELEAGAAENGARLITTACDVTDAPSCAAAVASVTAAFGGVDILVNCAGMLALAFIDEMDDDAWRRTIDANLTGAFFMTREVSKVMRGQGRGRIIHMSSMKGMLGTSKMGYSAYCASKGGVNMLTKQAAAELGRYGITVNAIAPSFIETDMNRVVLEKDGYREKLAARIPVGRIGQLEDLFGLVLLLVSDASAFISGQVICLDGGLSAAQE